MEILSPFGITIVTAVIGMCVQLSVFVVLYRTLRAVQIQNPHHEFFFELQRINDRNLLTFKFADWLSTEVKYYSPLYENNKDRQYILSPQEINSHLIAMANKTISLCQDNTVDVDIIKDEIERLIITLQSFKPEPTEIIDKLRKLL